MSIRPVNCQHAWVRLKKGTGTSENTVLEVWNCLGLGASPLFQRVPKQRRGRGFSMIAKSLPLLGLLSFPGPVRALLCPVWREASPGPAVQGHAMAWDSGRSRVVLFGGSDGAAPTDDTWERAARTWAAVEPLGSRPSARENHAMAYDAARGVTVLFGGRGAQVTGDTWAWNGSEWTDVSPPTAGPAPRADHAMAFDAVRNVVFLFGGHDSAGEPLGDTWEWDGTEWTLRTTDGPSPRAHHSMAFDEWSGVTFLFGGNDGASDLGDTWTWDGKTWQLASTTGPTPTAHSYMAYLFDMFSGVKLVDERARTWWWMGFDWSLIPTRGSPPRRLEAAIVPGPQTRSLGSLVLHGGRSVDGGLPSSETWVMRWIPCVPTVSTWGMAILALLVASAGTILLRRRLPECRVRVADRVARS